MDRIIFMHVTYGGKPYYLFDSENWKDRVFLDNPEEALNFLSNLLTQRTCLIESRVNLVDLVNDILFKKIGVLKKEGPNGKA